MNPYEVLGVSENADEETIKKAYKELVKKYHPDRYINNPLADLAAEKMKEINKAYDLSLIHISFNLALHNKIQTKQEFWNEKEINIHKLFSQWLLIYLAK